MLNRRYLRIKVFQALYAFFQTKNDDLQKGENELKKSIEQIYNLYIYFLVILKNVQTVLFQIEDEAKNKNIPIADDIRFLNRFKDNKVLKKIVENKTLQKIFVEKNMPAFEERDILQKSIMGIKNDLKYKILLNENNSFEEDKEFLLNVYPLLIGDSEPMLQYFEEKNIYWAGDFYIVNAIILKQLKKIEESSDENYFILPLYKDEVDDVKLVFDLFRRSVLNKEKNEAMINTLSDGPVTVPRV